MGIFVTISGTPTVDPGGVVAAPATAAADRDHDDHDDHDNYDDVVVAVSAFFQNQILNLFRCSVLDYPHGGFLIASCLWFRSAMLLFVF